MRICGGIVVGAVCLALVACGGSEDPTPSPTTPALTASTTPIRSTGSSPTQPPAIGSYLGAVVGTWRTVNGATYVTESGTGIYYSVVGDLPDTPLGQVLFVIGRVTPVPNVHLLEARQIITVPETGSVGCEGTLTKRDGRFFVENSAESGCGSIELIEVDPEKLDPQVGQATGLTVKYCTITKEGRMIKADLSPDFACSEPFP